MGRKRRGKTRERKRSWERERETRRAKEGLSWFPGFRS